MLRTAFGLRGPSMRSGTARPVSLTAWTRGFGSTEVEIGARLSRQRQRQFSPLTGASSPSTSRTGLVFVRSQRRGFRFSGWRRSSTQQGAQEKLSLSQKLRRLSKEYGWSAVGVYIALSALDFPFCFLLVKIVGADTIGKVEHYVVSSVSQFIPETVRQKWHDYWHPVDTTDVAATRRDEMGDKTETASGWGVEEAQQHHREEASLATQLALAYAIHKSFILFRVPLTAAVTPKVVKVLRSWGWNIGKRASP